MFCKSAIILITLVILMKCESFEIRYMQNSDEYDKNLMKKSINTNKVKRFIPKFDLKYLKNRMDTINLNENILDDLNIPMSTNGNTLAENLMALSNQLKLTTNSKPTNSKPTILNSALSYKTNISNNLDKFPKKEYPLKTQLNFQTITDSLQQQIDSNFNISKVNRTFQIEKHPIYFTNPLTGIVYAITEVGYNYSKISTSTMTDLNNPSTIPIYIPKDQYDRDMNLLKMELMKQCRIAKNQKKQSLIAQPVNKLPVLIKPIKIKKKRKIKIPKKTQLIDKHDDDDDDDEDDDENSESFDSLDGVIDQVFEVIDDSSSEEVPIPTIKTKQKKKNLNRKLKLKNQIEIKPIRTSTFIKNGNDSTKIMNKLFQTQIEQPNKLPLRGLTTVETIVGSYSLLEQTKPSTIGNAFSSRFLGRHISKRSIGSSRMNDLNIDETSSVTEIPIVQYTTPSLSDQQNNDKKLWKGSIEMVNQTTTEIPHSSFIDKKEFKKSTGHKKTQSTFKRQFSTSQFSSTVDDFKTAGTPSKASYIYYLEENYEDKNKLPVANISGLLIGGPIHKKSSNNLNDISTTPMTPPCKKLKKPNYNDDFDDDDDDDDDNYVDYPDFQYSDEDDDENNFSDEDSESDENSGEKISENNGSEPQQIVQRTRKNIEKKHKRKRKPNYEQDDYDYDDDNDNDNDNDDDDDETDNSGGIVLIADFFRMLFYPARTVFQTIFSKAGIFTSFNNRIDDDDDIEISSLVNKDKRNPKVPKYTVYNSDGSEHVPNNSWFSSWFSSGDSKDNENSNEYKPSDETAPGWFESWFDSNEETRTTTPSTSSEDDDYDGYWFLNFFESSKSNKRKPSSTTEQKSTTTASTPILTIANPMKNPHKWIGILAQHIVNSTATASTLPATSIEDNEPKYITYDKYQIWRLRPFGEYQVKALNRYKNAEEGSKLQWLQGPTLKGLTDVLVPPKFLTNFQGTLNYENIAHEILIFDVGKVIYYESKENTQNKTRSNVSFNWNRYQNYEQIIKFVETLQIENPNIVELHHVGRSYEGRPLIIVKIGMPETNKSNGKKKFKLKKKHNERNNGVFIEAGVYGREWITPASSIWIMNELVKIMKNNRTSSEVEYIKKTNWFIMPVLNPDGYEYSHEYDRMWKKSRSKNVYKRNGLIDSAMTWFKNKQSDKICFGVDMDQNWKNDWNGLGSSNLPCNEFFAGSQSFSEPEARIVSKFLMDHRTKIKLFVSFQSYGQIISYPNKLNASLSSHKLDDLLDVAMVGNDALRKSGSSSRYKIDSTNDLVAAKSGSSTQFAMYEAGIPFCYTIHLGDNGVHGYLLPGSYIEPTAKDVFEIIKAIIDYI